MANRPTGPEQGDDVPEPTQPIDPAPTAAQPPADAAPAEPVAAAPAPPEQPAWTATAPGPPAGPAPGWPPPHPPAGPPGAVRRSWTEATSSTGGRVALGAAAVLATLLVVAVIGLGAALVGGHRGDEVRGFARSDGSGRGPGLDGRQGTDGRRGPDANGPMQGGPMMRDRDGLPNGTDGQGQGQGRQRGTAGGMMDGVTGLDDVLHGEFTTTATGSPVVMVVQVGEVTAYAADKSITVQSSDGFEGTYDLSAGYASSRIGLPLKVGAQVRVVAAKDGMKATRLNVVG
ncbi:hypothetical protein [Phycicoccus sonneratiae]|uniref:DUF5666 domain-containing protein n=1 Tax=Phycicoccus sonneratiae TaxID=2807628 RepID=A0ABS2CRY9_9MICO|nr:hypothetical protein [Phycicoccus sonneraticus]MBM6402238.1 hypothetical protein [Phycicoccus sonneraticus]